MTVPVVAWLEIQSGCKEAWAKESDSFHRTQAILNKVAERYGLPLEIERLDEAGRELLQEIEPGTSLQFEAPRALSAGRLYFALSSSPGLKKTRENFTNLITGVKGASKLDRTKKLHYKDSPIHRIEKDFVAQGGDVTRGDGSGGEATVGSGGTFKAEPEGLSINPSYGSLAMAHGGRKDSLTSQFFIVLARQALQLKKLGGRQYVTFGQLILPDGPADRYVGLAETDLQSWGQENLKVLARLESVATTSGTPTEATWIEDCGVL